MQLLERNLLLYACKEKKEFSFQLFHQLHKFFKNTVVISDSVTLVLYPYLYCLNSKLVCHYSSRFMYVSVRICISLKHRFDSTNELGHPMLSLTCHVQELFQSSFPSFHVSITFYYFFKFSVKMTRHPISAVNTEFPPSSKEYFSLFWVLNLGGKN